MIYDNYADEIGTFESFFRDTWMNNGNIICPYINVMVWNGHPLNKTLQPIHIDRCYIAFIDAKIITENSVSINNRSDIASKIFNLGGFNIERESYIEREIEYKHIFLQTLDDTKFKKQSEMWLPIADDNDVSNMSEMEVKEFLDGKNVPSNLILLLKRSPFSDAGL